MLPQTDPDDSVLRGWLMREKLEGVRTRWDGRVGIIIKNSVLMTAFGTIAGMIPIAFEWAVGLERLSPLADVAIGGLLIGTILTLIYIPMFAYSVDKS